MKPRWQTWWRVAAVATDLVAVTAALSVAAVVRFGSPILSEGFRPELEPEFLTVPLALAVPVWLLTLAVLRLYSPRRCQNAVEEARRVVTGGLAAAVALVMVGFLLKRPPSRLWVVSGTLLGILAVGIGRRILRWGLVHARLAGRALTRTVVVGRTEAKRLVDTLQGDAASGLLPIATCGFTWSGLRSGDLPELRRLVKETEAGEVLIVSEDLDREEIRRSVEVADDLPVRVVIIPGLDYMLLHTVQLVGVGREPALALEFPSLRVYQRAFKRLMDVGLSVLGLVVTAPLWPLISLAIRLDSPGPVLFRQVRLGYGAKPFQMLKFRTMVDRAEESRGQLVVRNEAQGPLFKIRRDPRVTRVGRLLRRTSFDEIPQLWNVLRGDMSMVGPRPLPLEDYGVDGPEGVLLRRLNVRPGISGLWQVSGRSSLGFEELVRLDLTYVQNWNVFLDLYILLRTIPAVIRRRGAY